MTAESSNKACGIWAVSEALGENYENLYKEFYTPEREGVRVNGDFAGVVPLEMHHLIFRLGYFSLVWARQDSSISGKLNMLDRSYLDEFMESGRAVVGVLLDDKFTGHWFPVRYGMYKPYRYANWKYVSEIKNENWSDPLGAVLITDYHGAKLNKDWNVQ